MQSLDTHDEVREEPTLAAVLRAFAYGQLPARFYQLLQFALPLAIQCWSWGWWRTAGWSIALSAFGIWALCEQRLDQVRSWHLEPGNRLSGSRGWLYLGRDLGAAVAGLLAGGLLVEGFLNIAGVVFRCPGCAG